MSVAAPTQLWRWYVDYLWTYEPDSWVASTAKTFRALAILVILPGILLTFFDVASYVIARTLGDPTASTSARAAPLVVAAASDASAPDTPPTVPLAALSPPRGLPAIVVQPGSPGFFTDDDGTARLAGVGVFSPAASQPGSPVLSRRTVSEGKGEGEGEGEGEGLRGEEGAGAGEHGAWQNTWGSSTGGSTSGEESFALLERDESFEDAEGAVQVRRRVRPPVGAASDGT